MGVPCLWMINLSIHQISPSTVATEQSCRSPLLTFTAQPCPMAPCLCLLRPATHMGFGYQHPSTFLGKWRRVPQPEATAVRCLGQPVPPAAPRALAPGSCVATIRHPGPRPAQGTGRQPPRPCTLPSPHPGFCPRPVLPAWVQPGDRTPCLLRPRGQGQRGWRGVQPLSGWGSRGRHSLERGRGLAGGNRQLQAKGGQAERVTKDLHPSVLTEGPRGAHRPRCGVRSSPGWHSGLQGSCAQRVGAQTGQTCVSCEPAPCTAPREAAVVPHCLLGNGRRR